MRMLICGLFLAATLMLGCGPQPQDEPANVQLIVDPLPAGPSAPPAKSLFDLDFPGLWNEHGIKRDDPIDAVKRQTGLIWFGVYEKQCLATSLVGSGFGPGGTVVVAARSRVQPDVVARVKTASTKPIAFTSGGLHFEQSQCGTHTSTRIVAIGTKGTAKELSDAFRSFSFAVRKEAASKGATSVALAAPTESVLLDVIRYATPDRKGTIRIGLLPGGAKSNEFDAILSPQDAIAQVVRSMYNGKDPLVAILLQEDVK